jgi:predicted adenylyl cyclase CyaB
MREVELKAVVPDEEAVRARLSAAGAALRFVGTLHDRRYDTADRALRRRDDVLRLRVRRPRVSNGDTPPASAIVEFKGRATVEAGYKVREEVGSGVDDADALDAILRALGYTVTREVDREVAVYDLHGALVRLERYPRLDLLVEVEGDPQAIESAIATLGIARASFTAEPLLAFVRRFEARTGERAAICARELAGDYRYAPDDA